MQQDPHSSFCQIVRSMGVPVALFGTDYADISQVDHRLRERFAPEQGYTKFIEVFQKKASCRSLLKIRDSFHLYYYFYNAPDFSPDGKLYFCIGPLLREEMTQPMLKEILNRHELPAETIPEFFTYYNHITINENLPALEKTLVVVASNLFHQEISLDTFSEQALKIRFSRTRPENQIVDTIENMYRLENQMLDAIACGNAEAARHLFQMQDQLTFHRHIAPNPLRFAKDRMIVFNVLLRKAIETGGVHPVYIDEISTRFANRIEACRSETELLMAFPNEMIEEYCRLVRTRTIRDYHPLIQNCILYIEQHYSEELNLTTLAELHYVSRQYLSSLFKKETGMNLTDYIQECQMQHALEFLNDSANTVSRAAELCGYENTAYFTKIFKKYHGITPREYRKQQK